MRVAVAALLLFPLCSTADAVFTDFGDYTQYTEFEVGEVFTSKGLSFSAVEFASPSTPVPVRVYVESTYSLLFPSAGVEFLLPPSIQEVSLRYGGAGYAIAINGEQAESGPIIQTLLDELDGTTLGGASITAIRDGSDPAPGFLTLRGPINSLVIAGVELIIDDITMRVPEPTTIALLIVGAGIWGYRRC